MKNIKKISLDKKNLSEIRKYKFELFIKKIPFLLPLHRWLLGGKFDVPKNENVEKNTFESLTIIYRAVYVGDDPNRFFDKKRPLGFSYEACFRNLIDTISGETYKFPIKIKMLYNGTLQQYNDDPVSKIINNSNLDVQVILLDANSALEAVLIMFSYVNKLQIDDEDLIYIVENDYLHSPGWLDEVINLYKSNIKFDYVTLYDHPDRYRLLSLYKRSQVFVTKSHHWVTSPSTCGTFMMKYKVFKADFDVLHSYKPDRVVFERLTNGRNRVLLSPIPGLALHCMSEYLDPINSLHESFHNE